ncbi:hypothetical protein [Pleionea litopenaei]|uniref:Zinc ribbon protein n=1 Tax=Pleionea litopenaei TaxID=3070815 RepID=A0AA51RUV4_9GAMM|nr:hypothetical protein [Pleionea sp. HL-JVS1]WMS88005.1 hypothetical protein Q9312_03590 [Pleionea sp. HL-JVS1]
MTIIKCPECRNPISDKSAICVHCGFATKDATDEDIQRAARIVRLKRQQRMSMLVYTAMLVFVAGVLGVYFGRQRPTPELLIMGYIGLALGGVGYLAGRIFAIFDKRR